MTKVEGLDAAGITSWINGLDRPPLVSRIDPEESESKVEEVSEASTDHSDLSSSGHAFARASERLKSVGYRHREEESSGQESSEESDETNEEPELNAAEDTNLSEHEKKKVRELKDTDTRVRAHEMAHKAAAGSLAAGGPYYDLQKGPDGQNYAVGGEVPIRLPRTDDYSQALKDAQQAERAALAPADPSPEDYAAAAAFRQRAVEARAKLAKETQEDVRADPKGKATEVEDPQNAAETEQRSDGKRPLSEVEPPVPSSFSTSEAVDLDSPS